jgi:hypothetical protein
MISLCANRPAHIITQTAAFTVAVFAGSTAFAGIVPALELNVQELTTGYNQTFMPAGAPVGTVWYHYPIAVSTPNFSIDGSINGSPTLPPDSPILLNPTLDFTNNSQSTLEFIVTMTLPANSFGTLSQWTTSASWVLTGSTGTPTFLQTLPGLPLWTTYIDGVEVAALYDHPSGMGGSNGGNFNLNTAPESGLFAAVAESISIRLAFSITAGSVGGPTGVFAIIPGPASLALLGIAGLAAGRRCRRLGPHRFLHPRSPHRPACCGAVSFLVVSG